MTFLSVFVSDEIEHILIETDETPTQNKSDFPPFQLCLKSSGNSQLVSLHSCRLTEIHRTAALPTPPPPPKHKFFYFPANSHDSFTILQEHSNATGNVFLPTLGLTLFLIRPGFMDSQDPLCRSRG